MAAAWAERRLGPWPGPTSLGTTGAHPAGDGRQAPGGKRQRRPGPRPSDPAQGWTGLGGQELGGLGQVRTVPAGSALFVQGDPIDEIYLVTAGRLVLARLVGGQRVAVALLREGDLLGEGAFFPHAPAKVDAQALEDCEVLAVPGPRSLEVLRQRPDLACQWLASSARSLRILQDRLAILLARDARARVAGVLAQEADQAGRVELSQQLVAELVGLGRSTVNQVLGELEERGLIRLGYRFIQVNDRERLAGCLPWDRCR